MASLLAPVYVIIEPPVLAIHTGIGVLIQEGYRVVVIWTLVIYSNSPLGATSPWSFTLTAFFSSSPFFNVGILFLAEFVLLLAGCVLLFRRTDGRARQLHHRGDD